MAQSRPLGMGLEGPKASSAVASRAQDHGAEVTSLGALGTRQGALDQLVRQRHSKATPLLFVYDAGPCGSWLYRSLTQTGYAWGGALPL